MKKREQGMLTVESSIVLTLLLLFMLFLFSFARLYRAQNLMGHATIQTADAVALESFLRETALSSDINDVVYLANTITDSTAISAEGLESLRSANLPEIARQKFVAAIAPTEQEADLKLRDMGVRDGLDGIDFSQSWVDLGRDDVIIVATYTLEMQFPLFGGDGMTVTKTAKSKTFGDILFEVSTEVNQPSWGSTKGDDKVVHGSTIEISATPNYGYRFVSWNDGVTDNPRIVTVTNAMHYVAIFEKMGNGINLSINNGAYGVYETERGKVSGAGQYLYLDTVTITAQPKEHYWFAGWDDNGDGIPDNTSATRSVTIEQVEDTYFFSAIFRPNVYTVTVQTNNSTYGSAWVMQGGNLGTSIQAEYGSMVTLGASPNTNYRFTRWSHGDSQLSPTVRVEGNVTYTANFEPDTYTVTFYSNNRVHATMQVVRGSSVDGSNAVTGASMPHNPTASRQYFKKWIYNNQEFTGTTRVHGSIRVDAQFGTPNIVISGGAAGGNVARLTARTEPANMNVVWSSSDRGVIEINEGTVTAKYFGAVTITASFVLDGETYSASKTVEARPSITLEHYCRRDGFNSSNTQKSTYGPMWWTDSKGKRKINTTGMRFYYNYQPGMNPTDTRYGGNCVPGVFYDSHEVTWSQIEGATKVGPRKQLTKAMIVHDTATTGPYAGKVNPQVGYNASNQEAYIFFDGHYDKLWFIKETHAPLPTGNGYYDYYISKIN